MAPTEGTLMAKSQPKCNAANACSHIPRAERAETHENIQLKFFEWSEKAPSYFSPVTTRKHAGWPPGTVGRVICGRGHSLLFYSTGTMNWKYLKKLPFVAQCWQMLLHAALLHFCPLFCLIVASHTTESVFLVFERSLTIKEWSIVESKPKETPFTQWVSSHQFFV